MILGHSRAIKALKKCADEHTLAHGYLFSGPDGVGKRTIVEALANYLESKNFSPTTHILNDARIVVPDTEGKIGIDAVRELKLFLYSRPNVSAYRFAAICDAHRMTPEAQNALLKIAEEPPQSGVLILIASDPEALVLTLRSRLHSIYFAPVPKEKIEKWLCEEHACAVKVAEGIARASFGLPGRARRLLDEKEDVLHEARLFLVVAPAARKDLIKKIITPVDFNLPDFLDRCITVLALDVNEGKKVEYALWHRIFSLRQRAAYGTLNARIQLEALYGYRPFS